MSLLVGLTGPTGAGKSSVCALLAKAGFAVIDADQVAREVVAPPGKALDAIVSAFGTDYLADGVLNRKKLGHYVFGSKEALDKLNTLLFPFICQAVEEHERQFKQQGYDIIILDAPTLFESGMDRVCDVLCAVLAPKQTRLARIVMRDALSEEAALARMASQKDDAFFLKHCPLILTNDGDQATLTARTEELIREIKRMHHAKTNAQDKPKT